ncbi:hypothetical protein SAICODRAFT_173146 [Saitoella complicata NRRL Y-17804]|uniref:Uncharacterized protein n=1 Tax=Saitoella complicata (strain BCRC 22490 / CBS 7301 / JCM 7358 / NBRC 10748 / NRRL Y-17804) TaxID=698492 RepID=A0A0E9NAD4_SAICN|nr:uncharacterized protein SAICODRAFT_173146 [Saitoella complicata NRRL Y-17804]ODQ50430.1 hypothetical protein SAICODRAFT_173146 [Saitoella complicata NRRL Y-17804]GAO46661.1 hypothetical protein G7K_0887-t1 [Saitoella complicata NRRL Y-17804]
MSATSQASAAVTHADILTLFHRLLPHEQDLIFHTPFFSRLPQQRPYDPTRLRVSRIIISLTPTPGVYTALTEDPRQSSVLFLHRPWQLHRRRVPRGTLVLQSHTVFDALYTTGWNNAFADAHGVWDEGRVCLTGHKGDPERAIGLVGRLERPRKMSEYAMELAEAFGGYETVWMGEDVERHVHTLVSLNAFTPEILDRVAALIPESLPLSGVICLTGATRAAGLEDAQKRGMGVVAVGHQRCEFWGIRYFAREVEKAFAQRLHVVVVDEPEPPRPPKTPKGTGTTAPTVDSLGGEAITL